MKIRARTLRLQPPPRPLSFNLLVALPCLPRLVSLSSWTFVTRPTRSTLQRASTQIISVCCLEAGRPQPKPRFRTFPTRGLHASRPRNTHPLSLILQISTFLLIHLGFAFVSSLLDHSFSVPTWALVVAQPTHLVVILSSSPACSAFCELLPHNSKSTSREPS